MADKKGIVAFMVDVGTLPPFKAEAFLDRVKDKLKQEGERRGLDGWEMFFMPVRPPQKTRVEVFSLTDEGLSKVRPHVLRVRETLRVAELEAKLAYSEEVRVGLEEKLDVACDRLNKMFQNRPHERKRQHA